MNTLLEHFENGTFLNCCVFYKKIRENGTFCCGRRTFYPFPRVNGKLRDIIRTLRNAFRDNCVALLTKESISNHMQSTQDVLSVLCLYSKKYFLVFTKSVDSNFRAF